jgi:enamine deaminase RidA (YjgF/YER057c/UK114 family)
MLAYSRALVVGQNVYVSGTLPVDADGTLVGGDDAFLQARQVLHLLQQALADAGSSAAEVVRLRIYLRDSADVPAVARARSSRCSKRCGRRARC